MATDAAPGFGLGEHLLLWSLRRIVLGGDCLPEIGVEFAGACGEDGAEVLATFDSFVQALLYASRRRLAIGQPGSPEVTADERQILTLIAAAQGDKPALLEAHLQWLARPERRQVLQVATAALASGLAVNDLRLALPAEPPTVCERERATA